MEFAPRFPEGAYRPLRALRWVLPLCVVLTLAAGVVKVFVQRERPPSYVAGKPWQLYRGFVSVDGHAHMAACVREWFAGRDPSGRNVRALFAGEMHPSAVVVPGLVAVLDLAVGDIVVSFLAVSGLALLAQAWLAGRIVQELAPGAPAEVAMLASCLTVAHCLTIRTSMQILLDPVCAAFAAGAVLLTLRWLRHGSAAATAGLVAVQILGFFTKVSFAPFLAVPALGAAILPSKRTPAWIAAAIVLFALVPAALFLLYIDGLTGSIASTARESKHLFMTRPLTLSNTLHFGLEMALLFQAFPVLLVLRRATVAGGARIVAAALAMQLLATWTFHLPPIPRLYLPAVAPLAVLAALDFQRSPSRALAFGYVAVYPIVNYAIGAAGLFIGS